MFKLGEHDQVITAWADYCEGPGWSNTVVWVLVKSQLDGVHRLEALQPKDHTRDMQVIMRLSADASRIMTGLVRSALMVAEVNRKLRQEPPEEGAADE